MTNQQIPFSVLDLMPTRKDRTHHQTMRYTLEAAQAVERFGCRSLALFRVLQSLRTLFALLVGAYQQG